MFLLILYYFTEILVYSTRHLLLSRPDLEMAFYDAEIYLISRKICQKAIWIFMCGRCYHIHKESEKGVNTMCEIWEEIKNEGKMEAKIESAQAMLRDGSLPIEKIAEFTGLSVEKVRELAGNRSA